jgi:glucokinase
MTEPYYLGVDTGGTQMRMAAVTCEGKLATPMLFVATGKEFSADDFRDQLVQLHAQIKTMIGDHPIAAIGMGFTGLVGETSILQADFIPLLNQINVVEIAEKNLGYPAKIENDARCFVLAEARFGAGRGARHVVGITLGTGVGGGVIIDGKLHRGANGNGGEVWSIPHRGQWMEYFISGAGLVKTFQESGGTGDEIDAAKIAELARSRNEIAISAFQSYGNDLADLCETIRALIDPEVIVIGGSIANARDIFGDELIKKTSARGTRIAWAELGTAAGVIGAASLNIP